MVSVCLRVTLLYLTSCAAKHLPALTEETYDDEIVSPLDGDVNRMGTHSGAVQPWVLGCGIVLHGAFCGVVTLAA